MALGSFSSGWTNSKSVSEAAFASEGGEAGVGVHRPQRIPERCNLHLHSRSQTQAVTRGCKRNAEVLIGQFWADVGATTPGPEELASLEP